jgi:hypothetical protein
VHGSPRSCSRVWTARAVDENKIDELWSTETQRRAAMLDTGEASTLTWGEIEQRFAERRAQRDA